MRPLVMNVSISRFNIHRRHLKLVVVCPSGPFSPLSIISFFKLALCLRMGPRYIASTVTVDEYDRPSCRKSTSRLFGASVSLRKEISEGETVFVCMRFRLSWYSDLCVHEALYALDVVGEPGYVVRGVYCRRRTFHSCS